MWASARRLPERLSIKRERTGVVVQLAQGAVKCVTCACMYVRAVEASRVVGRVRCTSSYTIKRERARSSRATG
eukprot:scaffold7016_cov123-Isochrysis_galbana.AAC.3